jgi:hypothetical protein
MIDRDNGSNGRKACPVLPEWIIIIIIIIVVQQSME